MAREITEKRTGNEKGSIGYSVVDPLTGKHTGYFWLSYYDKSMDI